MGGFTQNNTFSNVGVAAVGRDNVSALAQTMIGNAALADLRSLMDQLEGDDRDDGLTIAADLELAAQGRDNSAVRRRLRQLGRFISGLAPTLVKTAFEVWLKAQIGNASP